MTCNKFIFLFLYPSFLILRISGFQFIANSHKRKSAIIYRQIKVYCWSIDLVSMQKKNNKKYMTKNDDNNNNDNREQLSKYEADYENVMQEKGDDDVVEVAMVKLHYAYEALQKEVHELEGVGKDGPSFLDASIGESLNFLKPQTSINQSAFVLEDLETEMDEMIKQKVNLEVQYIAITSQHMETMNRLEIAERKAIEIRRQYDKLKMTCDKILDSEDGCNVGNSVSKSTSMFGILSVLLGLVLYLVAQKIFSQGGMEDELATT